MKNRAGKSNIWIPITAVIVIALLGVIAFAVWHNGATQQAAFQPQTNTGGNNDNNAPTYISTGSTALSIIGADALNSGTSVSSTSWISIDGSDFTTGITTASPNQMLDILLVNNTAYHNVYLPGKKVPAAPTFPVSAKFYGNATVSFTVFNTNNAAMSAGGGATNQTVATGGAYNMKIRMDGQDKKSTQDMRCILEASDNSKTDKLTLTGFGANYIGMSKPSSYTLAGATSQVWVYDVSPLQGAVSPEGVIGATSKTGQSMAGKYFKITCYPKEYFVDPTDGKVKYDIEDSQGNLKSMASYSFTGYFT